MAERLFCAVAPASLRDCLVFRPGTIFGHSGSGASNTADAVGLLLCGLLRERVACCGAGTPLPTSFNLCPVDFVAHAIVRISAARWLRGGGGAAAEGLEEAAKEVSVFHLCAPRATSLATLCGWLRDAGHELEEIPAAAFRERLLRVTDEAHPLFLVKPMLTGSASSGGSGASAAGGSGHATSTRAPSTQPLYDNTVRALALTTADGVSGETPSDQHPPSMEVTPSGAAKSLQFLLRSARSAARHGGGDAPDGDDDGDGDGGDDDGDGDGRADAGARAQP